MAVANVSSNSTQITIENVAQLDNIWLPDVFIHGIPWRVQVGKNLEGNPSLAVYLHCKNEGESTNWAYAASALVKLLPFKDNIDPVQCNVGPHIFEKIYCSGYSILIFWDDLFKDEGAYVENDSIKMNITIEVANPNKGDGSTLEIEKMKRSCDCSYLAVYTISDIKNLMAVRSSEIMLNGVSWYFSAYKRETSNFSIYLTTRKKTGSFIVTLTVKILSSNKREPVEKSKTETLLLSNKRIFSLDDLISWNDLFKSTNCFIGDNGIKLEVGIRTEKQG